MCEYQELAFMEYGFVIRCKHCHQYQVCFGGLMLTLSAAEFQCLLRHVGECILQHAGSEITQRSMVISTPKSGVQIIVSRDELAQLQQLTEAAELELKVLDLLALFQ